MSIEELWKNSSKYNIGRFSIFFEKNLIDNNGNFQEPRYLIFHEYFHLVQHTTTIFGLWIFLNELDIFFYNSYAFKCVRDEDKFQKPYKCLKRLRYSKQIATLNHKIFSKQVVRFYPDTHFVKFVESKQKIPLMGKYDYPSVAALFKDNEHTFQYEISARCISEAYSKAVEYEILGAFNGLTAFETRNGEFEYYAARLILQKLFPSIKEKQVAVILHWSLNHVSPSFFFKEIVEYLKINYAQKSLPSSYDLSEEICRDIYNVKYSGMHRELLNELENHIIKRVEQDTFILPVLSEILCMYKKSLDYLSSEKILPALFRLYPFDSSYNGNVSLSSLLEKCSYEVPLPLYQREEDYMYFFIDGKYSRAFLRLETLFFVSSHLTKRKLRKQCPFHSICSILPGGKQCHFKIYEANCNCTLGCAMMYFR